MGLARISWLVTVVLLLVAAIALTAASYYGYAIVTFVLALSAGLNLL